jgi:hypothetical protein
MFKYLNKGISTPIAISIIVLITFIVGGGILAYQYWWLPKEEVNNIACTMEAKLCPDGSYVGRTGPNCEFAQCPDVKKDETADWKTYRDEEYGFEFAYPKEWGDIQVGSPKTSGFYPLISSDKITEKAWYHQPSGKLVFIRKGNSCLLYGGDQFYKQTLIVLDQERKEKIILENSAKFTGNWDYCRKISAVNLSPNGKYAYVIILGWEDEEPRIINIETGVNIIEGHNIMFGEHTLYNNIVWSPNNSLLAIKSEFSAFSGEGLSGVFLSAYNKPEQLSPIFSLNNQDTFSDYQAYYQVYDLHFINNNKLAFIVDKTEEGNLEEIKAKYEYDTQTGTLKKL